MICKLKEYKNSLYADGLLRHFVVMLTGILLIGSVDFFYHLIAVRLLSSVDYGVFNALVSLVMLAIIIINPLGMTYTQFIAGFLARKDLESVQNFLHGTLKQLGVIGSILFIVLVVSSPLIASFIKTKTIYIMFCAVTIVAALFSKTFLSLLRAFQKFKSYSLLWAFSSLGKLIIGSILIQCGLGVLGGIIGFTIQPILAVILMLCLWSLIFKREGIAIRRVSLKPVPAVGGVFYPGFLCMAALAVFINCDSILVKHFFSDLQAGYYAMALMAGKITLLIPLAISTIVLPKTTQAHVNRKQPLTILLKAFVLDIACCLPIVFACLIVPDAVLLILTGRTNPVSSSLVGLFSIAMFFYSLVWIMINFAFAVRNFRFRWILLLFGIIQVATIYTCHPSLRVVTLITLGTSIAAFAASLVFITRTSAYSTKD